jgi:hypothetical protein
MAKKAAAGPSKSEAIRNYKNENPNAGPTEIATALTKDGTRVTPQFVSTVLSNAKRKGGKRGRRRMARRGRPAAARATSTGNDNNDLLQNLVQAKKLADRLGGIDKAREALDVLAKLFA